MNVLDLFSGIGGFSLGLERAGMRTVAFCETDAYCRAVLGKHWPGVPIYPDVRQLCRRTYEQIPIDPDFDFVECAIHTPIEWADCPCIGTDQFVDEIGSVDVICAGFPCQDISLAGAGAGLAGERSGLWRDTARIIRELRPDFVLLENVSALLSRGLGDVLGDLAALGYDAEWHCIPAAYIGARHIRDRVWIVAHAQRERLERLEPAGSAPRPAYRSGYGGHSAFWEIEPGVGRVANGIPCWVDRIRALGNSIVPQIAESIGRQIMKQARS